MEISIPKTFIFLIIFKQSLREFTTCYLQISFFLLINHSSFNSGRFNLHSTPHYSRHDPLSKTLCLTAALLLFQRFLALTLENTTYCCNYSGNYQVT